MTTFDYVTLSLIAGTAVVWIIWDIVLGAKRQKTESQWLAELSRTWNSIPFFVGILGGHWFVQNPNPHYEFWPVALGFLVCAFLLDLFCFPWDVKGANVRLITLPKWTRYPGLWLLLGIPVGHFFFPQRLP